MSSFILSGRRQSHLDSLTSFLGSTDFDGCTEHDSMLVTRDLVVRNIVDMLSRGTAARILIKAPPFSGKTSILQMVIRSIQQQFEIVYFAGFTHAEEDSEALLAKVETGLENAFNSAEGRQIILVIDDCQRLYRDTIITYIVKMRREVHLLAAASYFIRTDDGLGDTPAEFNQFVGTPEVGITRQQCIELVNTQPFNVVVYEVIDCLLAQSQLGNTPDRYHLGIFKQFLIEFAATYRSNGNLLTAENCFAIIWDINLSDKAWMRRAFGYLDLGKQSVLLNPKINSFLREYLLPHAKVNETTYNDEISALVKSTMLYKNAGNELVFSVAVAKRFVTRIIFPGNASNGMYVVPASIDQFITDVLSGISKEEVMVMSANSKLASPNEYQWQQMCYKRLFDLLGPQYPLIVESSAADIGGSSGRMDVYLPTLRWILEYVQNASSVNAIEHHTRLEADGKYFTNTTKQFRVIDFRGNTNNKFKTAVVDGERLNHHITVWVTDGRMDIKLPGVERNHPLPFVSIANVVANSNKRKQDNANL
jgi:hypothetical protein